jgi:diguanylate cyclase (GGDEF)-like protein
MASRADRSPALQAEIHRLYGLLKAAKTVFSTLDLKVSLEAVLRSALRLTRTSNGCISLYDENRQELNLCAHQGLSELSETARTWSVKDRTAASKLKKRKLFIVSNPKQAVLLPNPALFNSKSGRIACVPLIFQRRTIGLLHIRIPAKRALTSAERRALEVLASFAAMAINHAKVHALTRELARTDGLTGLWNYRYFQERLAAETARAKRYNRIFSLLMVDVDNFKQINDGFGHPVGDRILQKIASIIKESIREMDIPARYGGEEFAVLLPETENRQASLAGERIRRYVEEQTPGYYGISPEGVRVSVGISTFPIHAQDKDRLLKHADEALYRAKLNGKNCIVSYDPQSADSASAQTPHGFNPPSQDPKRAESRRAS